MKAVSAAPITVNFMESSYPQSHPQLSHSLPGLTFPIPFSVIPTHHLSKAQFPFWTQSNQRNSVYACTPYWTSTDCHAGHTKLSRQYGPPNAPTYILTQQPQGKQYNSFYPAFRTPFSPYETQAFLYSAPRTHFGALGALFSGLEPEYALLLVFPKFVNYRLYGLEVVFSHVFGSEKILVDKQLEHFRDMNSEFLKFDGSRPMALLKFFKDLRIGLTKRMFRKA